MTPHLTLTLLFFLLGLVFGSFFNVVGLRAPQKLPFTADRSICPHCKNQLSWCELIPLLSFIFQSGKCRHCQHGISIMYPAIELITGLLFAFAYIKLGLQIELIAALLLIALLVIVFVSDMRYMLIPNNVLLFFFPLFILIRIVSPLTPWWSPIMGALTGGAIIVIIILASRGGMGGGDMKLFVIIGIVLGLDNTLLTLLLASVFGMVVGVVLLSLKIINRKQPVPFGPYIAAAAIVAYFYGEPIVAWYFNFLS
ncbi:type 4 prepilin peptidase 1 Aspartic peptidase. MEROPS family A24A [Lentibacillus persicus]|uniref:Type 4 prepilin peptidase 1 Aspartic peptidase. MEROPS family A24A n=1 Tax=Lentibacillus persicus TaxID=640948 RepID=A0A1I1TQJ0_9BACI|nr:A24 family peptidase [Lentibacillus persicus]SFD60867.1 type 4 prepilin peptidase 1 Aspartic peptidase. MEROPS family A24A [Lentibacillus persicus]